MCFYLSFVFCFLFFVQNLSINQSQCCIFDGIFHWTPFIYFPISNRTPQMYCTFYTSSSFIQIPFSFRFSPAVQCLYSYLYLRWGCGWSNNIPVKHSKWASCVQLNTFYGHKCINQFANACPCPFNRIFCFW